MTNILAPVLFIVAIFSIAFYVFFKYKTIRGFSFARTFPFESNGSSLAIKVALFSTGIFAICIIFFFLDIYFNTFENSYVLIAGIAAMMISVLFIFLNITNLVNLKAHFLTFSLFATLVTAQSIILGFQAIDAYKIDGVNVIYIVLGVLYFGKGFMELLLVSPLFKFSFLMEVGTQDQELKKPNFVRLAFYEWLYLFLFILSSFLLLIMRSL